MALNDNAKNAMLNALGALITHAAVHNGAAGTTGANQIATPRQAITWNAAAAGNLDNATNPVFDIPAAETVREVGFFSAAVAGTFYGSADVVDETYGGTGIYTLTDADISLT